jgi:hypothetical protein
MSIAVLELNDQNLLIQTEDGLVHTEPGFAHLTATGIETGDRARACAWQQTQHSYNQYWRQLNQLALPSQQNWARHHGDIAFAQLKQMLEAAGSPDGLIMAVPGSFSDEQLSLLLGLASAIPVQIAAVIDSALATCANYSKPTLLVELQLHQAVISLVQPVDGRMSVSDQDIIPDLGVIHLYNAAARYISDRMIEDYRYDPMHNSEGEQTIYDQLPSWLMQLGWEDEIAISLPSPQGGLSLNLPKTVIAELFSQRLRTLNVAIQKHSTANLCFAHSASLIPALISEYANAEIASQDSAAENCLDLQELRNGDELDRITNLANGATRNSSSPKQKSPKKQGHVTHLLYRDHAYPLHQPLSMHIADDGLLLANNLDSKAVFVVVVENQRLQVLHHDVNLDISLPSDCQPGQSLKIAGLELRLIEVSNA